LKAGRDNHFRNVGQLFSKPVKVSAASEDMAQVDPEHFTVFERIQSLTAIRRIIVGRQFDGQVSPEQCFRLRIFDPCDIAQDRKKVCVLQAQKVFPQEVADTQDLGECREDFRAIQRLQLLGPDWLLKQFGEERPEVQKCRFRIR